MGMCKGCSEVYSALEMKDGYCKRCRNVVENEDIQEQLPCDKCGAINKTTSKYCKKCGNKLLQKKEVKTKDSISNTDNKNNVSDIVKDDEIESKKDILTNDKADSSTKYNTDELEKLEELHKIGFLTKEDFEKKKKELL